MMIRWKHFEKVVLLAAGVVVLLSRPVHATDVDVDTTISGVASNNGAAVYNFGVNNPNLLLTITNGGILTNVTTGTLGVNASATNISADVTGNSSAWYMSGTLAVGSSSSGNRLAVSGGGVMMSAGGTIGSGNRNMITVTGSGSMWTNTGSLTVGSGGVNSRLTVSEGGKVYVTGGNVTVAPYSPGSSGHQVIVAGTGSLLAASGQFVFSRMNDNNMTISSGGVVRAASYNQSDSVNCGTIINGTGSFFELSGQINVSAKQSGPATSHYIVITNGGALKSTSGVIGNTGPEGINNTVTVTGPGSAWTNTGALTLYGTYSNKLTVINNGQVVGSTSLNVGNGAGANYSCSSVLVAGGGLLESGNAITAGNAGSTNNTLTNLAGVLQFTSASPAVTIGSGSGNQITINGGTLSYRNATGVDINANTNTTVGVGLFTWTGTNSLRLDNATAVGAYTFGGTGTTYNGLELCNTNTITGTGITVSGTGTLLVSNTVTSISSCTLAGGSTVNWSDTNSVINITTLAMSGVRNITVPAVAFESMPITMVRTTNMITDSGSWVVTPSKYGVKNAGTRLLLTPALPTGMVIMVR